MSWPKPSPATLVTSGLIGKLRVLAFGGIGDAILLTPALRAIANAGARRKVVVWTMNRAHEDVFKHNPHVESVRYVGRIARYFFDTTSKWARWMPYVDTDYSRTLPSLVYTQEASHIIAETLGLALKDITPELYLTRSEISAAANDIRNVRRPNVAIHVQAASSPNKNWPLENWKELIARNPGTGFVQVGQRDEPVVPGACSLLGTGLRRSFAVIKQCDAFIGIDSALGHAATALRTPAVILFGASTPTIWGHTRNTNLYARRYCSPCIDRLQASPCPFSVACMSEISVELVEKALRRLLSLSHSVDY
jgi:ADP-heptose:LPS heptosyltransferase